MKVALPLHQRTQLHALIAASLFWFGLLALCPLIRGPLQLPLPLEIVVLFLPAIFVVFAPFGLAYLGLCYWCAQGSYFTSYPIATVLAAVLTPGTIAGFCWWVVPFILRAYS